ncbi:hypothetical protein L873DRAFT_1680569, partial [Choiromyces venosus 120613-1]
KYNIQGADWYHFDETGFRTSAKIMSSARCIISNNSELVNVCETISGDGAVLPPMIIVPGVIHQLPWYTSTCIPDDYLVSTSESCYNNNDLTIKWLAHFQSFLAL